MMVKGAIHTTFRNLVKKQPMPTCRTINPFLTKAPQFRHSSTLSIGTQDSIQTASPKAGTLRRRELPWKYRLELVDKHLGDKAFYQNADIETKLDIEFKFAEDVVRHRCQSCAHMPRNPSKKRGSKCLEASDLQWYTPDALHITLGREMLPASHAAIHYVCERTGHAPGQFRVQYRRL